MVIDMKMYNIDDVIAILQFARSEMPVDGKISEDDFENLLEGCYEESE
jgi:hypothetical protein